jgi:hypothetical protein
MEIPAITVKARPNGFWSEEKPAIYYESVMSITGHLRVLQLIVKFGVVELQVVRLSVHMAMTEGLWSPREGLRVGLMY